MLNVSVGKKNVASMLGPDGMKQMKIPLIYEYDLVKVQIVNSGGEVYGTAKFG